MILNLTLSDNSLRRTLGHTGLGHSLFSGFSDPIDVVTEDVLVHLLSHSGILFTRIQSIMLRSSFISLEAAALPRHSAASPLQSINATPAPVKSGGTTLIAAVFAFNQLEGQNPEETQLSAGQISR